MNEAKKKWHIKRTLSTITKLEANYVLQIEKLGELRALLQKELHKLA